MLDPATVDAYLGRLGIDRPAAADADALRRLHQAHLRAIPFENLSIHLGEPIVLEVEALVHKLVDQRRGGFCYELNGAFAALLEALGFTVTRLAARVFQGERLGPPFDHLALRVETPEPWLADVGFGAHSLFPLRWDDPGPQPDPGGTFAVAEADGAAGVSGDIDVGRDGHRQYRIEPHPRALADFGPTCWWQQTSPESHFTRSLTCSLPTHGGRVTLSGRRLIVTEGTQRTERSLGSDAEVLDAYRTCFGIVLDRVPVVAS